MSKLPKGITKRGDRQYMARLRPGGKNVSKTFETAAEAIKWYKVTEAKVISGERVITKADRDTRLSDVLQRYLDEITPAKKGRRQETLRLKAWLASPLAVSLIGGITRSDISAWIKRRTDDGCAPSTVSNEVNLLSAVFRQAREWGYSLENPCVDVKRPRPRQPRFVTMTAAEQAALIEACRDHGPNWLVFTVRLALTTAMRQGEIRSLRWEHIHTEAYWLHLEDTKNGTSRDVPLTAAAVAVLTDIKATLPRRLDGFVFGDPNKAAKDGGCTDYMVSQAFADAADHTDRPDVDFHDLRHVSITALADLAPDVVQLSKMTGHKSLSSLARYYNKSAADIAVRMQVAEALQG